MLLNIPTNQPTSQTMQVFKMKDIARGLTWRRMASTRPSCERIHFWLSTPICGENTTTYDEDAADAAAAADDSVPDFFILETYN